MEFFFLLLFFAAPSLVLNVYLHPRAHVVHFFQVEMQGRGEMVGISYICVAVLPGMRWLFLFVGVRGQERDGWSVSVSRLLVTLNQCGIMFAAGKRFNKIQQAQNKTKKGVSYTLVQIIP